MCSQDGEIRSAFRKALDMHVWFLFLSFLSFVVGSDIVGINCHFDPTTCLDGMRKMKSGLDAAGLKPHLMVQPLAYHTPDAHKQGFIDLPEFPFGKNT